MNSPLNPDFTLDRADKTTDLSRELLIGSNGKRGDLKTISSSPSLPAPRPGERGMGGEFSNHA
jgi:hypothetical protein